jgi:hypothetical protein
MITKRWAWWWALGACLLAAPVPAAAQSIGGNASLAVTTGSARVPFPVTPPANFPAAIIAPAPGTTAEIFYALGNSSVVATTSSPSLPSGGICLAVGPNTNLAAIVASGSATVRITQVSSCGTPFAAAGGGSGGGAVTQGTVPWVDSITLWGGGTLGAMANYGTSPGAVLVPGVNAFITNVPAVSQSGTWTVQQGGAPWSVSGTFWPYALGQTVMASSVPVAIASNQSSVPVTATSGTYQSAGTAQYALSVGTNTQLTVPVGARCAYITVETASVRRTSDGVSASTTIGTLFASGAQWADCGPLASYKFTAVSGSPTLDVEYFK